MNQILSLHIGQAGIQVGSACWELLTYEQGLRPDGGIADTIVDFNQQCPPEEDYSWSTFFEFNPSNKYTPRAILIDLEPTLIDEIRNNSLKELFRPDCMVTGKEDAASNFGRGMYTIGREFSSKILNVIRKQVELCHNLSGFFIYHSMAGGTGSGLATLLIQELAHEYPRLHKQEVVVYPCPRLSTAVVDPYNAVLSTDGTLESSDCAFMMDNEALYDISTNHLDIEGPTYTHLNQIIAQVISSVTASLRFQGSININISEFRTNLVPYPRIHFPLLTYAPLYSTYKALHRTVSMVQITRQCFQPTHQLLKCDPSKGKYMAICMMYRGIIKPKEIAQTVQEIKDSSVQFVNWCPSGFKIGINYQPPVTVPGSDFSVESAAAVSIANTTSIGETWARVNYKFDLLFSKRAYVHWYLAEGMDEQDFVEARENLAALEQDYIECENDSFKPKDQSEDSRSKKATFKTVSSNKVTTGGAADPSNDTSGGQPVSPISISGKSSPSTG
ncbi:tubulin alpha-4 chain-like [Planococcus citri]|uniref:tubulin alpha-4 chain-like n=1 Tax=Planococcus citri TaxID=170843 RepID=UPI0031F94B30